MQRACAVFQTLLLLLVLSVLTLFAVREHAKLEQIKLGSTIHAPFTEVSFSVVFYCVNELEKLVGTGVKDKRDAGRTQGCDMCSRSATSVNRQHLLAF